LDSLEVPPPKMCSLTQLVEVVVPEEPEKTVLRLMLESGLQEMVELEYLPGLIAQPMIKSLPAVEVVELTETQPIPSGKRYLVLAPQVAGTAQVQLLLPPTLLLLVQALQTQVRVEAGLLSGAPFHTLLLEVPAVQGL
jgi:hypothetical protein